MHPGLSGAGAHAHAGPLPSPALIGGIQAGRSEFVTNPQAFTNGSGSDLRGWRELSFPFHIKRRRGREDNLRENSLLISIVSTLYSVSLTSPYIYIYMFFPITLFHLLAAMMHWTISPLAPQFASLQNGYKNFTYLPG